MRLWRVTDENSRRTLRVTRSGFEVRYERPKVGGGWYSDNVIHVPWRLR